MANLQVFAILNQTAADSGLPQRVTLQGLGIRNRFKRSRCAGPFQDTPSS